MPIDLERVHREAAYARKALREHPDWLVNGRYGVSVSANVAGVAAEGVMQEGLQKAAAVETIRTVGVATDDGMGVFTGGSAPVWAQYAVFEGPVDERTCPLCGLLIGHQVKVGSSEYYAYYAPLHINCLVPAQGVLFTPDGYTTIECVRPGDRVIGHDGERHEVTAVMRRHYAGEVIVIEAGGRRLQATPEHPVLTQRGWVLAGELTEDDEVMVWDTAASFMPAKITSLRRVPYHGEVYNLSVEGVESFVAQGIAVHNCRHWYAYHEEKVKDAPDFETPDPKVLKRYGHFVTDKEKYKELRVPATPSGRSFIFRRVKNPDTGEIESKIEWLKQPEMPVSNDAKVVLRELAEKPKVIPAEAWEAASRGPIAELQRAGYVRIESTLGEAQTMRVAKDTVGEVETFLRQSYAGAKVARVEQAGTLDLGGGRVVPQWEVTYQEANAKRVSLNRWGKLAAQVAGEE